MLAVMSVISVYGEAAYRVRHIGDNCLLRATSGTVTYRTTYGGQFSTKTPHCGLRTVPDNLCYRMPQHKCLY